MFTKRNTMLLGSVLLLMLMQPGILQASTAGERGVLPGTVTALVGPVVVSASAAPGETVTVKTWVPVTYETEDGSLKGGVELVEFSLSNILSTPLGAAPQGSEAIASVATCYATLNWGSPTVRWFSGAVEYEYYYGYVWYHNDWATYVAANWPWSPDQFVHYHEDGPDTDIFVTQVQGFTAWPNQLALHRLTFTLTGSGGCSAEGLIQ